MAEEKSSKRKKKARKTAADVGDVAVFKEKFARLGLDSKAINDVLCSAKISTTLSAIVDQLDAEAGAPVALTKETGTLLLVLTQKLPGHRRTPEVSRLIVEQAILQIPQIDAVSQYLRKTKENEFNLEALKTACGAGVVVTKEEIEARVAAFLAGEREKLEKNRYVHAKTLMGKLCGAFAKDVRMKWSNSKLRKEALDAQLLALLGPKTPEDEAALKRKPVKSKGKAKKAVAKKEEEKVETEEVVVPLDPWSAEDTLEGRHLDWAVNSERALAAHLKATGGKVITRFPPEPNGFLHLGHAKAMRFNFLTAEKRGGECILRYDDTNPEAEKQLFIDTVHENVCFLGYTPAKVTFSSDYFQNLFDLAVELIRRGHAYVCHQTATEIEQFRELHKPSPYRERSVEENLKLFNQMRKGLFEEGECTLRMKGDLSHANPNLWDLVFYRIKYAAHPHVGAGWCIYPSYDFTHCIVDSIENITHSLCTLEFEVRRESYYWLLDRLDLYKPKVWEYSRLNVAGNVMSKRKLKQLVEEKHVHGWDDPRLLTINGLRRRGYTAEAINEFCDLVGVTRGENLISRRLLDHCLRKHLNTAACRRMAVAHPLKVVLTNFDANKVEMLPALEFPQDPSSGSRLIPFSRVLYIERADFEEKDRKGYFRLAPGKTVHLKYAFNITCNDFEKDANGRVTVLHCTVDLTNALKPKGKIHWVAEPAPGKAPVLVEFRDYGQDLFTVDVPSGKDWLKLIDPQSEVIVHGFGEPALGEAKPGAKFQFERIGYYCVDKDSTEARTVCNRAVTLRESKDKKKLDAF